MEYRRYTSILFSPGKSISEVGSASRGWGGSRRRQISVSGKSLLTGRRAIPAKICAPCLAPRVFPSRFLSRGKLGLARTISLEKRSSRRRGPDRGCCRRGEGVDPKSGAAEKKGANLPDETSCENSEHVSRVYVTIPACACSPYSREAGAPRS